MPKKDPRVDAYIRKSAHFAQPILKHLRSVIHAACPEVEETVKWNMPSFMYKGILCGMAAFKGHCTFGFWKHALVVGERDQQNEAMGQFGRITSIADLPSDKILIGYIKKAMQLNDAGIRLPRTVKPKKELVVPGDLTAALKKNGKAKAAFENFTPSHKREYVEWITEAKRDETRQQRLRTTIEWLAKGKPRNWKYMNC